MVVARTLWTVRLGSGSTAIKMGTSDTRCAWVSGTALHIDYRIKAWLLRAVKVTHQLLLLGTSDLCTIGWLTSGGSVSVEQLHANAHTYH